MSVPNKLVSPEIKVIIIDEPVHLILEETKGKFILVIENNIVEMDADDVEIRQVLRANISL